MKFNTNSSNIGPDMVQPSSGGIGVFGTIAKAFGGVAGHKNSMDLIEHRAKWDAAGRMAVDTHKTNEGTRGLKEANVETVDHAINATRRLDEAQFLNKDGTDSGVHIYGRALDNERPISNQGVIPISSVGNGRIETQKTGLNTRSSKRDKGSSTPASTDQLNTSDIGGGIQATGGTSVNNTNFAVETIENELSYFLSAGFQGCVYKKKGML